MAVVVLTTGTSWTKLGTVTLVQGWGAGGSGTTGIGYSGGAFATIANPTGVGSTVTIVIGSTGTDTNWNSGQLIAKSGNSASTQALGSACTPSTGAFNGGFDSGGNGPGGGAAGPDGAGRNSTALAGGAGDNGLGGAGGSGGPGGSNPLGGGGGDAVTGGNGGVPGGGAGLISGSTGGGGQLSITYTPAGGTFVPISRWPIWAPILAQ
jgi:hypothetical protein